MPRYLFEGYVETVLHGLSHGVNATLHRGAHGQPDGSTVVARPGDEVTTKQPYPHAHMHEIPAPKAADKRRPVESDTHEGQE